MSIFSEFARMQRDMDRMMRRFDREFGLGSTGLWDDDLWAPQRNWMDIDQPAQQTLTAGKEQTVAGKKPEEEKRLEVGKEQTQVGQQQQQQQVVGGQQQQQVGHLRGNRGGVSDWLAPFTGSSGALTFGPRVDIQEQPDKYLVTADLPGIPKENIKVDLNSDTGVLTLSGHTEHSKEEKDEAGKDGKPLWVRRERSSGSFTRSLRLPADIQKENLKAKLNHGVLTVELPRMPQAADAKLKSSQNIAIE